MMSGTARINDFEEEKAGHMTEQTLEIGDAARILGISTEAVRKRIKRGSLKAQKNGDGQWQVILDEARMAALHREYGAEGSPVDAAGVAASLSLVRSSAAIEEALRDEVDVLRDEITFLRDEVSGLQAVILSLTQHIKLLETPRQESGHLSWWQRLKGRFLRRQPTAA